MLFLQSHSTWSSQTSLRTSIPTGGKEMQQVRIRSKRLHNTFKSSITATIHTLLAPQLHKVVLQCQEPNYHQFQKEFANICWTWWSHPVELQCLDKNLCPGFISLAPVPPFSANQHRQLGTGKGFLHNTSRQTRTKVN